VGNGVGGVAGVGCGVGWGDAVTPKMVIFCVSG
jgi:hypothetical protein